MAKPPRRRVALQLSLSIARFESPDYPGQTVAQCPELDLCTESGTEEEALLALRSAVEEYFDFQLGNEGLDSLLQPTPGGLIPDHAAVDSWQILVIIEQLRDKPAGIEVLFPADLQWRPCPAVQVFVTSSDESLSATSSAGSPSS